jgi:hypothetical protein
MPNTKSFSNSLLDAPLVGATFHSSAVPDTNSVPNYSVGTPLVAATFPFPSLRSTVPDTNSSPLYLGFASLVGATLDLRAMSDKKTSPNRSVGNPPRARGCKVVS